MDMTITSKVFNLLADVIFNHHLCADDAIEMKYAPMLMVGLH